MVCGDLSLQMAVPPAERTTCFSPRASLTKVTACSASFALPTPKTTTTIRSKLVGVLLPCDYPKLRLGRVPHGRAQLLFPAADPSARRQRRRCGLGESLFPPDAAGHLHHHKQRQNRTDRDGQAGVTFKEEGIGKQH